MIFLNYNYVVQQERCDLNEIYMILSLSQTMIDVVFNAYQRSPAFILSDDLLIWYADYLNTGLEKIQIFLCSHKDCTPEMKARFQCLTS